MFYKPYLCRVRIISYGSCLVSYLTFKKKNVTNQHQQLLQISKNEVDQRQIQSRRKPLEPSSFRTISTLKGSQRNNATFTWQHQKYTGENLKEREAF